MLPPAPIAVREVHLDAPPADLTGLDGYAHVAVFFRFRGTVVGRRVLGVKDGAIRRATLASCLHELSRAVWHELERPADDGYRQELTASVVVCTHNRVDMLGPCLDSLRALDPAPVETIVVDSGPVNEETRLLVAEYPGVRYIRCVRKGLDIARNAGLDAARGDIIAFTDDDARVDRGWIGAMLRSFHDPLVGVATGITLPAELETPAQVLFENAGGFGRGYSPIRFRMRSAVWSGAAGAGVNMAVRRTALGRIGPFDEALDGGTPTLSGGDHDFFSRTLSRGFLIRYDPGAVVWHSHRRDMGTVYRTLYGYGVGVYAWWTRALLLERELGVLLAGPLWFVQYYVRGLWRSITGRRPAMPARFALAELLGALRGPFAYIQARYFSRL